jgi:hypothetical protein
VHASRVPSRWAIRGNSSRRRKKTRRWRKPANGPSRTASSAGIISISRLEETEDTADRQAFLDAVAHGSAAAWRHLNLLGEYDFFGRQAAG